MKPIFFSIALSALGSVACASTYHVNFVLNDYVFNYDTNTETTNSDSLRVTGEIVTDGAIGALTYQNFENFTFTFADNDSAIAFTSGDLTSAVSVVESPDTGGVAAEITTDDALVFIEGAYLFTATPDKLLLSHGDDWMFAVNPIVGGVLLNDCYIYGSFTADIDADTGCVGLAKVTGTYAEEYDLFLPNTQFVFGEVKPVPLPSSLPLLGAGLILISMTRRKCAGKRD